MEHSQDLWIFILSDGSGYTGKRVLEAALLQFDQIAMLVRVPHVATVAEVHEVVAEAARRRAMIVYTLVALAAIGVVGWRGYQRHRHGTETTTHDLDTPEDRHRFLGFAVLLLAGLSALATLYAAFASAFFIACQ